MAIPVRPRTLGDVLAALLFATVLTTAATACLGPSASPSSSARPSPSASPSPSPSASPSPSPSASANPSPSPEFSLTGTGDITVAGSVDRGPGKSYAFGLAAGLKIAVTVTSTADDARVTVIDPDGTTRAAEEVSAALDKVTAGTWTFRVTARADATRYTLHITAA